MSTGKLGGRGQCKKCGEWYDNVCFHVCKSDKPMGDTPRSTKRYNRLFTDETEDYNSTVFMYEFAQELERELNANRQAFSDYMTKATIEANDLKHEIGNLRQHFELLKEQNRVLGEEIGGRP